MLSAVGPLVSRLDEPFTNYSFLYSPYIRERKTIITVTVASPIGGSSNVLHPVSIIRRLVVIWSCARVSREAKLCCEVLGSLEIET